MKMLKSDFQQTPINGVKKQSFKWVEIPVDKFNEVGIPQNVSLLNQYRLNILKYQKLQDWKAVQREQTNASRVVKQLGVMLKEMDALRFQVIDSDLKIFDDKIKKSRQVALKALQDYIDVASLPPPHPEPVAEDENNEISSLDHQKTQKLVDMCELAAECQRQAAVADMWEQLQTDVQDVHTMFNDFSKIVHTQGEDINKIENNVDVALDNVVEGNKYLAQAAKLKAGMYPLAGAVIGTCIGGPVGLVAGVKLGSLTAVGCSILGYTGGRFLKNQEQINPSSSENVSKEDPLDKV